MDAGGGREDYPLPTLPLSPDFVSSHDHNPLHLPWYLLSSGNREISVRMLSTSLSFSQLQDILHKSVACLLPTWRDNAPALLKKAQSSVAVR